MVGLHEKETTCREGKRNEGGQSFPLPDHSTDLVPAPTLSALFLPAPLNYTAKPFKMTGKKFPMDKFT